MGIMIPINVAAGAMVRSNIRRRRGSSGGPEKPDGPDEPGGSVAAAVTLVAIVCMVIFAGFVLCKGF